jgi:imidazolonepropionase-like amidohydrolase
MCENSPRAIFPKRKIGKIEDGYEASFIVLSDNPLDNILKIRAISFKVKNGKVLN